MLFFYASAVDLDCINTAAQDICSEREKEREEGELNRKNSMSLFTFFDDVMLCVGTRVSICV